MCSRSQRKEFLIQGIEIYKPNGRCWMDYKITKDDPLTYHHIIPQRDKSGQGRTTLTNMAMLTSLAHLKFNIIERIDPITAKQLNRLFQELNLSLQPPTDEYYEKLYYYLDKHEKKHIRTYIKY